MTNQEILEKAIKKAIDSGWLPYFARFDNHMTKDNITVRVIEGASNISFDYTMKGHIIGVGGYNLEPFSIIFNHDFAKALWGDGVTYPYEYSKTKGRDHDIKHDYGWQYNLQQMVVAPNPIQYLGANI